MRVGQSPLSVRGLPAPRWGRAPLFAYRGLRLPPPSRGRIPLGLAGVRRAGLPRACECACGHSLAVLCLPRGGAPPRVPLPRAVRAAVSRPLPSRVAAGGGVRARVGPLSPGGCFPWVVTPGWTRRMDGGSAGPLRRGSRGVFGSQPWWGLVRGGGGPPRVLRPAGVPGVAGPLSCWWRWDPVHVYPVARFASSLARALPPNHSPHALPALARSAPPPRHRRPTPSVPASTRWLKARRAPDPPSWDRNRPRRCWVLSPPQPLRLWGGGRPRAKCSRPLVRRVSGRAGCRGVGVAARAGERSGGRS